MSTTSATTTVHARFAESRITTVAAWTALALVFIVSYGRTLHALALDWLNDPAYSFGAVAPFAIVYILHNRRHQLRQQATKPNSLAGLTLIAFSQIVFAAGDLAAEFFLQRSSIVILIAGVVVYLAGWGWFKQLLLPLALFQLCIPLPSVVLQEISIPLQLVSSSSAAALLRICGCPVYRSGNILQLPHQMLSVTEACSGLRSLASMLALALVLVSTSRLSSWTRGFFIASAVFVAVIANALRITSTGLIGEYIGRNATLGLWHSLEGWFVFVTAFLILLAELAVLQRFCAAHTPERRR